MCSSQNFFVSLDHLVLARYEILNRSVLLKSFTVQDLGTLAVN